MKQVLGTLKNVVFPYQNTPINAFNFVCNIGLPLYRLVDTCATLSATPNARKDDFYGNFAKAFCVLPLATASVLPLELAVGVTGVCYVANKICLHWATNKPQPVPAPTPAPRGGIGI